MRIASIHVEVLPRVIPGPGSCVAVLTIGEWSRCTAIGASRRWRKCWCRSARTSGWSESPPRWTGPARSSGGRRHAATARAAQLSAAQGAVAGGTPSDGAQALLPALRGAGAARRPATRRRFRAALEVQGSWEVAAQPRSLVLKQGTLLDTLVAPGASAGAARGVPPTRGLDADGAGRPVRYKVHLGVDADTGVVRRAASRAKRGIRRVGERGRAGDLWRESNRRRQWLRAQGINDRIMHRSASAGPHWQRGGPHRAPPGGWWRRSSARSSAAMATSGSATAASQRRGAVVQAPRKADTLAWGAV